MYLAIHSGCLNSIQKLVFLPEGQKINLVPLSSFYYSHALQNSSGVKFGDCLQSTSHLHQLFSPNKWMSESGIDYWKNFYWTYICTIRTFVCKLPDLNSLLSLSSPKDFSFSLNSAYQVLSRYLAINWMEKYLWKLLILLKEVCSFLWKKHGDYLTSQPCTYYTSHLGTGRNRFQLKYKISWCWILPCPCMGEHFSIIGPLL